MRTVKLVVIGSSGVGKTSLRSQYISGRFTTGYRATIGADFITKTLPHHSNPQETITLQIWDTAGQERFSSLSSAFFRGADAVMLMYDVNEPETLEALTKWWNEFKDRAPLRDEDVAEFCCVVVGNKMDLVPPGEFPAVMEADALRFVEGLCPPEGLGVNGAPASPWQPPPVLDGDLVPESLRSGSIEISDHRTRQHPSTRGHSGVRSRSLLRGGTASSTRTALSIYHTPSSSLFEHYESARTSPTPASRSPSPPQNVRLSPTSGNWIKRKASSSSSTSSTPTITPRNFPLQRARTNSNPLPSISQQQDQADSTPVPDHIDPGSPRSANLERKPRLFFTSAKTGDGVSDVFEYVAKRAVLRWEYQENIEARTMHMQESTSGTVRLGIANSQNGLSGLHLKPSRIRSCCSS
ncbi:ras-domain-containing protein [Thelephora terrestris]|uniref:Ras-domain-containing protein n=1 Tax=Thelephora terrestris TaxID=56493 RepID=A0A9P6H8B6_9AGAM|nr:ras-domain-containing protein [Thelephora terrestris]